MKSYLPIQELNTEDYTKKAQKLYAILNIENDNHLSIEEITQEYEKCFQSSQKQNINDLLFYANR